MQIYQARGYVQVNAGTKGAIDIWGGPDPTEFDVPPNQRTIVATHACRPSPIGPAGYYESKLGELFAFTHPRDALGSRMLARGPNILGYGERIASVRRPQ